MELLTGEYRNTLDEKGRLLFPAKLRSVLNENTLMITQGLDGCLWLYPPAEWKNFSEKLMQHASPFDAKSRSVLRHLIAPAQQADFDKSGRISIPQSLRTSASLSKDCVILGINKYIEIWDVAKYSEYLEKTEITFKESTESLSEIFL